MTTNKKETLMQYMDRVTTLNPQREPEYKEGQKVWTVVDGEAKEDEIDKVLPLQDDGGAVYYLVSGLDYDMDDYAEEQFIYPSKEMAEEAVENSRKA